MHVKPRISAAQGVVRSKIHKNFFEKRYVTRRTAKSSHQISAWT